MKIYTTVLEFEENYKKDFEETKLTNPNYEFKIHKNVLYEINVY